MNSFLMVLTLQSVNIAMIATSPNAARETVTCIKTILNSRERPLMLHLIVSEQTEKIFAALFDTWQLPIGILLLLLKFYKFEGKK